MRRLADATERTTDSAPAVSESIATADSGSALSEAAPGRRLFVGMTDRIAAQSPSYSAFDRAVAEKLVVTAGIDPVTREQYRKLAATLHRAQLENGHKVIMLTSALAGEGKTLTAANLALTLSHSYVRNVADLRNPMMREIFGIAPMRDPERHNADSACPVQQVRPHLWLMLARRPESDPISTLTSDRMRETLAEARETFDWVLIDTPPVGLLPDANLLAGMVDGVLMVISAGRTPYDVAQQATDAVGRERVIGVVLNRVDPRNLLSIDHYAHYFGSDDATDNGRFRKTRRWF